MDQNPYPKPSNIARAWDEGWAACQRDVMDRLQMREGRTRRSVSLKDRIARIDRSAEL